MTQPQGAPFALAGSIDYQQGAVVSRTLLKSASGSVTLFAFDASQGLSEHTTPHEALAQVIDGRAEIALSGSWHTVREGEMLLLPAGEPHAVRAPVRFKMLLTMLRDRPGEAAG